MDAAVEMPPPLQVFEYPRHDPEDCFPNVDHFMRALQDPGETPRSRKHGAKSGGDTAAGSTASEGAVCYTHI